MQNYDFLVSKALELGAADAKIIKVAGIKTGAWTRWKCQFGCPNYGRTHCCPPNVPDYKQTQEFLKEYTDGLLVQFSFTMTEADMQCYDQKDTEICQQTSKVLLALEREAFLHNYYKAFALKGGTCRLCKTCNPAKCNHPREARPSMEAVGIDVFAFARDNGYQTDVINGPITTLKIYTMVLID